MQDLAMDPAAFRSRMRRLASARTAILLQGEQIGGDLAFSAMTAGCAVTVNRPYLLMHVCKSVGMGAALSPGENLTVSLLFGECTMDPGESFATLKETGRRIASSSEIPKNTDSIDFFYSEPVASFKCRVLRVLPSETHDIFLCLVLDVADRPVP
ncbi:hypothetical protein [Parvibaculum sp.]|uniref:hypothetical protein n=1 Tax=Parvibaculum sp. TaxID=2024848 RepID=UPI001D3B6CA4|nr:hypothetical protein [Parvibaculum sp.]MBX3490374.1 hypothetical protein [Parvibaculum sp.]